MKKKKLAASGDGAGTQADLLKLLVENMTGGADTVLYDDAGRPLIMCALPVMT